MQPIAVHYRHHAIFVHAVSVLRAPFRAGYACFLYEPAIEAYTAVLQSSVDQDFVNQVDAYDAAVAAAKVALDKHLDASGGGD